MANVKMEFSIGDMKFSGEGDEKWLSVQLDKIIAQAKISRKEPTVDRISPTVSADHSITTGDESISGRPLAAFLVEKNAKVSQVRKFLVTAVWLGAKYNKTNLTTREITIALRTASQTRLGNSADCLNQNVAKGFCEKIGNEFFVTDDGRKSIVNS
ncbi:hypothetical protein A3D88_02485 [Candidatus Peribacteria bacterium RIFCSPHIGHO2_02_FULL_52_16]|nr:MAG: hypothetical protein A2706_00310 [Candidatus Peribacteria bacterium RIFCSPHIGHO2_01_FULL_51_35]OGJ61629.1 MAG: hypothetical protein A3D88_02485 [Candidatus Peribacteria bacterium RIFCSPHIGHO2_02_FULL_52_16]